MVIKMSKIVSGKVKNLEDQTNNDLANFNYTLIIHSKMLRGDSQFIKIYI